MDMASPVREFTGPGRGFLGYPGIASDCGAVDFPVY